MGYHHHHQIAISTHQLLHQVIRIIIQIITIIMVVLTLDYQHLHRHYQHIHSTLVIRSSNNNLHQIAQILVHSTCPLMVINPTL